MKIQAKANKFWKRFSGENSTNQDLCTRSSTIKYRDVKITRVIVHKATSMIQKHET